VIRGEIYLNMPPTSAAVLRAEKADLESD